MGCRGRPCTTQPSLEGPAITEPIALPPGFEAIGSPAGADPFAIAVVDAAGGGDPGRVHWGDGVECRAGVVLQPDRPVTAETLRHLALLALFDALATLSPPSVPVDVLLPGTMLVDGGWVGRVRVSQGEEWAVVGFDVAMRTEAARPGETPGETCLAEEGFGDVSAADLVGAFCRHLLVWVDTWRDEGAAGLAGTVRQRARVAAS